VQQARQLFRLGPAHCSGGSGRFFLRLHFSAGTRRVLFPELPQHFVQRLLLPLLGVERERAGQQLVKHHAKRVNVGARIQVADARIGLFRTHVGGSSNEAVRLCEYGLSSRLWPDGFCKSEIDNPRRWFAIHFNYQNIRRLQVAMNDGFLVRVQHAVANFYKEF
jgi:hypothetical protein